MSAVLKLIEIKQQMGAEGNQGGGSRPHHLMAVRQRQGTREGRESVATTKDRGRHSRWYERYGGGRLSC